MDTASDTVKLKNGIRTSEFWLVLATYILGAVVALGVADPDGSSSMDKIVGMAASALAAFGYTISRGKVKAAAEENK